MANFSGYKEVGKLWKNRYIHTFTDNVAVEIMLRTGRSRNKLCMDWLREPFWCSFVFNFEILPHRISSTENIFCDAYQECLETKLVMW